jgi:hypothetical protein
MSYFMDKELTSVSFDLTGGYDKLRKAIPFSQKGNSVKSLLPGSPWRAPP